MTQGGFGYHAIWKNLPKFIRNLNISAVKQAAGLDKRQVRCQFRLTTSKSQNISAQNAHVRAKVQHQQLYSTF